jgi:hypothetical protein
MAKKPRKRAKFKLDDIEDFYDTFEKDFNSARYSRDTYSAEWGDYEREARHDTRRRVERRRDMKKAYSQLDEWEKFSGWTDRN